MAYQLYNARFQIEFGCGKDTWRIHGNCPERSKSIDNDVVMPSTPKSFDPETNIMLTISGSIYEIVSYENKNRFIEDISKCIENGAYERC